MLKFKKLYSWTLVACLGWVGGSQIYAQESALPLEKDTLLQGVFQNNLERKYSYYFLEGVRQKNNGNKDGAFELFKYCINLDPSQPEAYYQIGSQLMEGYKLDKALPYLEKAVELDTLNYWYNESLFFTLYSMKGEQEKAIVQLEAMTQRFPNKTTLQFQLLELYGASSSHDKMLAVLESLEQKLGKNEQLSMQKFRVYLMKGEESKAYAEVKDLIKAYPNDPRYKVILADLYLSNKKAKEGYNLIKEVLAKNPDFPMAIYTLANYYLQTGNEEKYLTEVEKIILNPQADDNLKLNLVRQYITDSNTSYEKVVALFEKAMVASPEDTQLPMLYVQYLLTQNKDAETKPVLEKILSLDPTNTPSRLMLLNLAVKADDYKAVIDICEAGILSSPSTIEFYYYLSVAYNQAEEYAKIITTIDKALTVVDQTTKPELISDFYAIKGDAYHSLNEPKLLYSTYDKALEHNPDNYGVLNNYAYFLSVDRQDLEKAEAMSKRTVDSDSKNATFLDTYAWILFELKRYKEAKVYIDAALENGGGESGVVVEHAGDIYWKCGEKDQAMSYWKQADQLGAGPKIKEKIAKKKYIAD